MGTATEEKKLNGVTINAGLKELFGYLDLIKDKDGKVVKDPNSERADRINSHVEGLQKIVQETVTDPNTKTISQRPNEKQARDIVDKLGYALAQTYGFNQKPEELPQERKVEYINNALTALGIPGVTDPEKFVASIMNMAKVTAKPGDQLYDANSALVRFLQHIASRKDTQQGKINYLITLIQGAYQHPDKAMDIQKGLKDRDIKVGPTATLNDVISEITAYGSRQTQKYVEGLPKTYHP